MQYFLLHFSSESTSLNASRSWSIRESVFMRGSKTASHRNIGLNAAASLEADASWLQARYPVWPQRRPEQFVHFNTIFTKFIHTRYSSTSHWNVGKLEKEFSSNPSNNFFQIFSSNLYRPIFLRRCFKEWAQILATWVSASGRHRTRPPLASIRPFASQSRLQWAVKGRHSLKTSFLLDGMNCSIAIPFFGWTVFFSLISNSKRPISFFCNWIISHTAKTLSLQLLWWG